MKKLSLVLAAVVLSASISFAQESKTTTPAKGASNNTDKGGKSTKSTKTTKTDSKEKAAKPAADKK